MGQLLFGVDVAGLVQQHIAPGMPKGKYTRYTIGARGARTSAGPSKTPTTYDCRGMWIDYDPSSIDGTLIMSGDRKALVIGNTLPSTITPQKGDEVTFPDPHTGAAVTLEVVKIELLDPAGATYTLQCRSSGG